MGEEYAGRAATSEAAMLVLRKVRRECTKTGYIKTGTRQQGTGNSVSGPVEFCEMSRKPFGDCS
jgi:hypothetical protein